MPEPTEYLTHNERELLGRRQEFEFVDAIKSVSELSILLAGTTEAKVTVDKLRSADPEFIKKFGGAIRDVLVLLDELPALAVIPETAEPVTVTPVAEVSAEEPIETEAVSPETPKIGIRGVRWLTKTFGEKWSEVLGLSEDAGSEALVDKIVSLNSYRKLEDEVKSRTRLKGLFDGLSDSEIAALTEGDNFGATSVHFSQLSKKLKQNNDGEQTDTKELAVQSPEQVVPPEPTTAIHEKVPEIPETLAVVAEVKDRLKDEPRHVQLAVALTEILHLSGMQKFALQAFLDPKSNAEMTASKVDAVKRVRDVVRDKIDDLAFDLTDAEKQWVRKSFGVYTSQGQPNDREPVTVHSLLTTIRHSHQQSQIPELVYSGLDKLFIPKVPTGTLSIDQLTQPAVESASVEVEDFNSLHAALIAELAETNKFSDDQLEALAKRSRYGKNGEHQEVSEALKTALKKIETQFVLNKGINSGSDLVDKTFKKFISPNLMISHLDAIKAELPVELQQDPEAVERIIAVGLLALYAQQGQRAA